VFPGKIAPRLRNERCKIGSRCVTIPILFPSFVKNPAPNITYAVGATASSGLPVTLRVESGPAVIADGKITVTAPGTVWVIAEQSGETNYLSVSKTRGLNMRQAVVSLAGQYSNPASAPVP
jgi:hypothetical protein